MLDCMTGSTQDKNFKGIIRRMMTMQLFDRTAAFTFANLLNSTPIDSLHTPSRQSMTSQATIFPIVMSLSLWHRMLATAFWRAVRHQACTVLGPAEFLAAVTANCLKDLRQFMGFYFIGAGSGTAMCLIANMTLWSIKLSLTDWTF
jgi:hypothetical protein